MSLVVKQEKEEGGRGGMDEKILASVLRCSFDSVGFDSLRCCASNNTTRHEAEQLTQSCDNTHEVDSSMHAGNCLATCNKYVVVVFVGPEWCDRMKNRYISL